jgi:BirA family biotin operon repressor/biotin-[acetyl-CoA-carboxylase] ligase
VFAIDRRPVTESTNDDAAALLGDPAFARTAIVADYQRAGRGRRDRAWIAPPGSSLLFTAILPETIDASALWATTFWTALGVAEGVERATGTRLDLQWPNDLLLDGRKCCGILCISRVAGSRAWIGCGVGLNVERPTNESDVRALAEIVPPPAFLSDVRRPEDAGIERDVILGEILASFEARADELARPDAIARAWERRAALDRTPYRIHVDGDAMPFDALARRLGPDGALIVERDGVEQTIALADARVVRDGRPASPKT